MESSRKLSEIKSLHDKIRVSTEETKKKEEIYKQLVMDTIYAFLLKARYILADLFYHSCTELRDAQLHVFWHLAECLKSFVPFLNVGNRVRKSSSGRIAVSIYSEDFRNRQQHQKTEGGNYKGTSKSTWQEGGFLI